MVYSSARKRNLPSTLFKVSPDIHSRATRHAAIHPDRFQPTTAAGAGFVQAQPGQDLTQICLLLVLEAMAFCLEQDIWWGRPDRGSPSTTDLAVLQILEGITYAYEWRHSIRGFQKTTACVSTGHNSETLWDYLSLYCCPKIIRLFASLNARWFPNLRDGNYKRHWLRQR